MLIIVLLTSAVADQLIDLESLARRNLKSIVTPTQRLPILKDLPRSEMLHRDLGMPSVVGAGVGWILPQDLELDSLLFRRRGDDGRRGG